MLASGGCGRVAPEEQLSLTSSAPSYPCRSREGLNVSVHFAVNLPGCLFQNKDMSPMLGDGPMGMAQCVLRTLDDGPLALGLTVTPGDSEA